MTDNSKFNTFELDTLYNNPELINYIYQNDVNTFIIKLINNLTDKYNNNIDLREQIIEILYQYNTYQLLEKLNLQNTFIENILIRDLKLRNQEQILLGGAFNKISSEKKKKELDYINYLLKQKENESNNVNKQKKVRKFLESMYTLKMYNPEYDTDLMLADLNYIEAIQNTINTPLFIEQLNIKCCCNDPEYFNNIPTYEKLKETINEAFIKEVIQEWIVGEKIQNESLFLESFIFKKYIEENQATIIDDDEELSPVSPASPIADIFQVPYSFKQQLQSEKDMVKKLRRDKLPHRQQIIKRNNINEILRNSRKPLFMNDFIHRKRCGICECCNSKNHHIKITQLYQLLDKSTIFIKEVHQDVHSLPDKLEQKNVQTVLANPSKMYLTPSLQVDEAKSKCEAIVNNTQENIMKFFKNESSSNKSNLCHFKTLYEYIIEDLLKIDNKEKRMKISTNDIEHYEYIAILRSNKLKNDLYSKIFFFDFELEQIVKNIHTNFDIFQKLTEKIEQSHFKNLGLELLSDIETKQKEFIENMLSDFKNFNDIRNELNIVFSELILKSYNDISEKRQKNIHFANKRLRIADDITDGVSALLGVLSGFFLKSGKEALAVGFGARVAIKHFGKKVNKELFPTGITQQVSLQDNIKDYIKQKKFIYGDIYIEIDGNEYEIKHRDTNLCSDLKYQSFFNKTKEYFICQVIDVKQFTIIIDEEEVNVYFECSSDFSNPDLVNEQGNVVEYDHRALLLFELTKFLKQYNFREPSKIINFLSDQLNKHNSNIDNIKDAIWSNNSSFDLIIEKNITKQPFGRDLKRLMSAGKLVFTKKSKVQNNIINKNKRLSKKKYI